MSQVTLSCRIRAGFRSRVLRPWRPERNGHRPLASLFTWVVATLADRDLLFQDSPVLPPPQLAVPLRPWGWYEYVTCRSKPRDTAATVVLQVVSRPGAAPPASRPAAALPPGTPPGPAAPPLISPGAARDP